MVRGEIDPNLIDEECLGVKCANPKCTNFISGLSKYCSRTCAARHYQALNPERNRRAQRKHYEKEKDIKKKEEEKRMMQDPKYKYKQMLNCPTCGSSRTIFSFSDNQMRCEKCGHKFKRPDPPKGD